MNNKFIILAIFLFVVATLNAELSFNQIQQAREMINNNPSLLNNSEAQKMMQQHNTNSQNRLNQNNRSTMIENNIDITPDRDEYMRIVDYLDNNETNQSMLDDNETNQSIRLMPQEYKTNDEELKRIKSIHTVREDKELERFSKEFFRNKNKVSQNSISAPSNYIISRGDTVTFWVYGATNTQHKLIVNSRGNINIPKVGPVRVAGEKYSEVKELLTSYLSSSYKNSNVVVDLDSFSIAQVTLTGFVQAPGIFNTSSVSSVKDILIEAHGISDVGSVRNIQIKRNGQTIATIDYYHLLSSGKGDGDIVLQPNDTIFVPRAYGLVRLEGAVNNEAIFEIERNESLSKILSIAGGVQSQADGLKIQIKRYNNNRKIEYKKITLTQAKSFRLKDGDEIFVGEMDETYETYVNILGNIVNEGKRNLKGSTVSLSKLLNKEIRDNKHNTFFLENTKLDYAVIKRVNDDTSQQMFSVNLKNILDGIEDFTLQNRDSLYVYNNLDTKQNLYVTIRQALTIIEIEELNATQTLFMQDGKHLFTEGMTVEDLINAAGIKGEFDRQKIKIVSHDIENIKTDIKIINYKENPNFKLKVYDTVYLFDHFETNPTKTAYITGEVIKPGNYEISQAMTLAKFIQSAGGLSQKAYPKECEIVRYHTNKGERKKKIFNIKLSNADSFILQQFDEVNIKRIPNWYDRKIVTISGEVKFPGTYVIHSGERLSSIIRRAGGYTKEAFLYGAVFAREEIAILQKESIKMELSKLKEQLIFASMQGSKNSATISVSDGILAVDSIIKEAEKLEPIGRITIDLGGDDGDDSNKLCEDCGKMHNHQSYEDLKGKPSDLTLKDKDSLHIPSFNDTVIVSGEVMRPMASTYLGNSIKDYISKCGGITELADTDHIYVMHANGEAQKATLGSYLFASNNVTVKKGDAIIVPKELIFKDGMDIVRDVADIFYKLSLTVASMKTVGAL